MTNADEIRQALDAADGPALSILNVYGLRKELDDTEQAIMVLRDRMAEIETGDQLQDESIDALTTRVADALDAADATLTTVAARQVFLAEQLTRIEESQARIERTAAHQARVQNAMVFRMTASPAELAASDRRIASDVASGVLDLSAWPPAQRARMIKVCREWRAAHDEAGDE